MGQYMSANISMSVKTVIRIGRMITSLPVPRQDPDNPGFAFFTAKEARKWVEYDLDETPIDVRDFPQLVIACEIIRNDMSSYIYQKTQRADQLELKGIERKDFLRKATKEYRLIFA